MGFSGLVIPWASWRGELGRPTSEDSSLANLPEALALCWSHGGPSNLGNMSTFSVRLSLEAHQSPRALCPFCSDCEFEFLSLPVALNLGLMRFLSPALICHLICLIALHRNLNCFGIWIFQYYPFGFHLPSSNLHIVWESWEWRGGFDSIFHHDQAIHISSRRVESLSYLKVTQVFPPSRFTMLPPLRRGLLSGKST